MKITLKVPKTEEIKRGTMLYGTVESESSPGLMYVISKFRRRAQGIYGKFRYSYICSCPDWVYRQRDCKHILAFKEVERKRT